MSIDPAQLLGILLELLLEQSRLKAMIAEREQAITELRAENEQLKAPKKKR